MTTVVADSNGLVLVIGAGDPNTNGVSARSTGYTATADASYIDTTAVGTTQRLWTWHSATSAWV